MKRHDRVALVCIVLVVACAALACSTTSETPVPQPSVSSTEQSAPGSVERASVVKLSAVVEKLDPKTRMVTLRRADDSELRFRVDDSVRNLDQVKQGDIVDATYYESIAIHLRKPGEAVPGVSAAGAVERAQPGSMPGAAQAQSVTVVATIRALDREKQTATLEDADGSRRTIAVRNPAHFDVARVGDLVEITYTEAVAISVEKSKR